MVSQESRDCQEDPGVAANETLRVVVSYEHLMVLEGLGAAIEAVAGLHVVGTASSPSNLLQVVGRTYPNVVVLSIEPPIQPVLEMVRQLKEQSDAAVLLICSNPDSQLMQRSFEVGCSALLAKDRSVAELVSAVFAVSRGDVLFSSTESSTLPVQATYAAGVLTVRELEVLALLTTGKNTRSIAASLTLSPHTVRNHVKSVLVKLGVNSRLEAVAVAWGEMIGQDWEGFR